MRRIDLFCKLIGPLLIALINGASTEIAIIVNFAMNAASVIIEYFAIAQVHEFVPGLQQPKPSHRPIPPSSQSAVDHNEDDVSLSRRKAYVAHLRAAVLHTTRQFQFYVRHTAFRPSFALALLYLTVLSFSGQMVTYLLSAGFDSFAVGASRTASTAIELSATWIAPVTMKYIGPIRSGIWFAVNDRN